ncbi:MAG: recombinase family protein [Candidatus Sulfotelmatobacter sp.]|jgi:DNA invertase Pin-like site-specific DNA recombinase
MEQRPTPVAQYLRMSTEHQRYSLDNQQLAIQAYADLHGLSVVQTYTDGAKTGVVLKRRSGLQQLLQDVVSGNPGYKAILVYDVSRWGRFQDADESAHYEFLCKSAGIPVHYCAEVFANDGSVPNALLKALKRTMAGEYSRELGVKVFAGLKRLAKLGFKQGGLPGYGLRRMLISAEGKAKQILAQGEHKSIATDRVVLVPGPVEEVDCVREIYRLFLEGKRTVHGIAQELNRRNTKYIGDSKWDQTAVLRILSHPKYTGYNVFGRTSQKLYTAAIRIPESEWIRTPNAFAPLVDEGTFQKAQRLLRGRTINKSNEEVLEALRSLLARKGRLSLQLVKEDPETPSPSTYRGRFGSLRRAYELIGYGRAEDFGQIDMRRRTRAIREELINKIQVMFPTEVSMVRRGGRWRSRLRLKNGRFVSVIVCRSIGKKSQHFIWRVNPLAYERRWVTLLVLLNMKNEAIHEMRVFPNMNRPFHLSADHQQMKRGERLNSLSQFLEAVKAVSQKR